jgi:hypothetical protein
VRPTINLNEQMREFLRAAVATARMNDAISQAGPKAIRIVVPAEGWQIQINQNPPIPFEEIVVTFDVDEERHAIEVASKRIAELVLSGFGTADIVIFGDQIERHSIDPETGAVV